jgi:hypothetical protein
MTQIQEAIKILKWLERIIGTDGPLVMLRNKDIMCYLTDDVKSKIVIGGEKKITLQTVKKLLENIKKGEFPRPPITTIVNWLDKIIGIKGPIYLDTGIMEHLIYELESGNRTSDMITIKGETITIKNVRKAFEKIDNNEVFKEALLRSGRSYYLDNIIKLCDYKYKIGWGS